MVPPTCYPQHGTPNVVPQHGTPNMVPQHGNPQRGTPNIVLPTWFSQHGTPAWYPQHGTPNVVPQHGTPSMVSLKETVSLTWWCTKSNLRNLRNFNLSAILCDWNFLILSTKLHLGHPNVFFPSGFIHQYFVTLHVPCIIFSPVLSSLCHPATNKNHETP